MKHKIRKALALLCLPLFLSATVSAADSAVSYVGGAEKFLFAPGSAASPTDLFPNFKDVMPGDVLEQRVSVNNDPKNACKIKLYLRSKSADAESEALLSQLRLTVRQDGDSILFGAPESSAAGLEDWVFLGTFYSGAQIALVATLEVPLTAGNEFQKAAAVLNWEFKAEQLPVEPSDPSPKTGGESPSLALPLHLLALGLALFFLLLFLSRRRAQIDRKIYPKGRMR